MLSRLWIPLVSDTSEHYFSIRNKPSKRIGSPLVIPNPLDALIQVVVPSITERTVVIDM